MGRLRDIQEDKAGVKFDLDLVTLYTISRRTQHNLASCIHNNQIFY